MAALKKSTSRTKSRTRRSKKSAKRGKKVSKKGSKKGTGGGGLLGCCKKKEKRVRVHRGSAARKRHAPIQKSKRDVKRTGQPKSQKSRKSKSSRESVQKSSKSKKEKKLASIREKQQEDHGKVTLVPPVNQQDGNDQQNDQNNNNTKETNKNLEVSTPKIEKTEAQQDQAAKKEEKEKKEELAAPNENEKVLNSPATAQKVTESGDIQYPSQRFEILQYVENKCYVRKWVYEESVPISMTSKMRKLLKSSQNKIEQCRADKQNRHELYNDLDQLSAIFDAA